MALLIQVRKFPVLFNSNLAANKITSIVNNFVPAPILRVGDERRLVKC